MKALSLVRKVKTLREVRYGGGGQSFSMSVLTKMSQTRSEFRSSHQINVKQWPDFSQFVHCSEKRCEDTLSFLSSMNKLLSKEYFVQPLFFFFFLNKQRCDSASMESPSFSERQDFLLEKSQFFLPLKNLHLLQGKTSNSNVCQLLCYPSTAHDGWGKRQWPDDATPFP